MSTAQEFYREVDVPLLEVESIEIAELCKVAENAYRYVQIAFAEELRALCQRNRINFRSVRRACNSKWNVDLPEARDGIGGTCLPKDIRYLVSLARKSFYEPELLLGAIQADRRYLEQLPEAIVST
jgi:UDP-N-acetyl-D-mannosaminuronate dehydrogenase